jgi:hypothetical protein
MQYAWTCRCCGKQYDTLPLNYGVNAPAQWFSLPESERATRAVLTDNYCRIDDADLFLRGCIEIPVHGLSESFVWGAWVSLSEESMERAFELWDAPLIENEPPRFGWLCSSVATYPQTVGLKTNVHFRPKHRPFIELEPTDHPLALEQRNGMTIARVEEIAAALQRHH